MSFRDRIAARLELVDAKERPDQTERSMLASFLAVVDNPEAELPAEVTVAHSSAERLARLIVGDPLYVERPGHDGQYKHVLERIQEVTDRGVLIEIEEGLYGRVQQIGETCTRMSLEVHVDVSYRQSKIEAAA